MYIVEIRDKEIISVPNLHQQNKDTNQSELRPIPLFLVDALKKLFGIA